MIKLLLLVLSLPSFASAQQPSASPSGPALPACSQPIQLYCAEAAEKKDPREIFMCLVKNDDKLSTECKQELQRFAQASRQTAAPGGGPMGALGGMLGLGAQVPTASYEGRILPSPGGAQSPSVVDHNLSFSTPVYKSATDTVTVNLGGGNMHVGDPIRLDTGVILPTEYTRGNLGVQFSRRLTGSRMWGVRGSVGYNGDKIDPKTEIFDFSANYSYPGSEGQWVLLVLVSNNSPFGTYIPVPGFFYIYRTPTLTGLFGLPVLSVQWTPTNPWAYSVSLFGPQIKTEASYGSLDATQVFTSVGWRQQRLMLTERKEDDDRMTIEEKTAEIGLRRPLFHKAYSELQSGYSFDRSVAIGNKLFNRDGGVAKLEPTWFAKWSLKVAF